MNTFQLTAFADIAALGADTIIDVRAPSEFAEDHLPGAINLPVLSDAERAEVGTMYKQVSPFDARKTGGALVARNTAAHLQDALSDKDGSWQPLVYCWRGGQRSGAFATILDQVGWRVQLLQGGYRSYRRLIVQMLYDTPLPHRFTLVSGGTGTAKTDMLHHLRDSGAQVLDLEGLARHRGSLFGAVAAGQPSQKMFESGVAAALAPLDPARLTWVEAESSKIGDRIIPPSVWAVMSTAPRVELSAPLPARARYLAQTYADLTQDPDRLSRQIDQLRPFHAGDAIDRWQELVTEAQWTTLAGELMQWHYDPRYRKSAASDPAPVESVALDDLEQPTLANIARDLAARFT